MPISSIIRPVLKPEPGGFLKKQPALRAPCGCVSIRLRFDSSIRRAISAASPACKRSVAPKTNSPSLKEVCR
jgi:hypothetical protein